MTKSHKPPTNFVELCNWDTRINNLAKIVWHIWRKPRFVPLFFYSSLIRFMTGKKNQPNIRARRNIRWMSFELLEFVYQCRYVSSRCHHKDRHVWTEIWIACAQYPTENDTKCWKNNNNRLAGWMTGTGFEYLTGHLQRPLFKIEIFNKRFACRESMRRFIFTYISFQLKIPINLLLAVIFLSLNAFAGCTCVFASFLKSFT